MKVHISPDEGPQARKAHENAANETASFYFACQQCNCNLELISTVNELMQAKNISLKCWGI